MACLKLSTDYLECTTMEGMEFFITVPQWFDFCLFGCNLSEIG